MSVTLALISDTHIPSRAAAVPERVVERVRDADHTIHAGDFDSAEALATVQDMTDGDLTPVRGNVDDPDLSLPAVATVEFEGVEFVVTHGTGPDEGYEARVAGTVREHGGPDAVGVSGHTHAYADRTVDGVRLLNPGSATGADPASETSMMTVTVADGEIEVDGYRE